MEELSVSLASDFFREYVDEGVTGRRRYGHPDCGTDFRCNYQHCVRSDSDFGMFGLPEMGITGAAIATVCGQIIAALVVMKRAIGNHRN